MKTVLENGPPIGRHNFSSDLICQRMPPVPKFPGLAPGNFCHALVGMAKDMVAIPGLATVVVG